MSFGDWEIFKALISSLKEKEMQGGSEEDSLIQTQREVFDCRRDNVWYQYRLYIIVQNTDKINKTANSDDII